MSELEDRLNAVMNDPAELERIAAMARTLMGNIAPEQGGGSAAGGMPGMAEKLVGLLKNGERDGLVKGLSPYLTEKRRRKLAKALRLASAASAAGTVFAEMGGEEA
ncbi:MAG: hypothetical protein KBS46_02180 [Clostridiales bacterium]|nr:hypothetical protein [Candidatus Apopatocola equi]MCQ2439675.1 hypothetical protein [Oscillospiraceae bacterium]